MPADQFPSSRSECEFCLEFESPAESRFGQIYGSLVNSRIVAQLGDYVAIPTIGQILKGSLLILPGQHFETMAESLSASSGASGDLRELLSRLEQMVAPLGHPLLVEHGAKCHTGAACGVYHAHMHLVPVPRHVAAASIFPVATESASTVTEALKRLAESDHYLLVRDTHQNVAFAEPGQNPAEVFSSQYVRRRLTELFDVHSAWNWREYNTAEPWVLETIAWFEKEYVSFG